VRDYDEIQLRLLPCKLHRHVRGTCYTLTASAATCSTAALRAYTNTSITLFINTTLEPRSVPIAHSQPAPIPARSTYSPTGAIVATELIISIPALQRIPNKNVGSCTVGFRSTTTLTTNAAGSCLQFCFSLQAPCKVRHKVAVFAFRMFLAMAHFALEEA
jgi:hypothetical protein